MRNDTRVVKYCNACNKAWLCEKENYVKDSEQFVKMNHRKPMQCSCGRKNNWI